jgi:excisionase family DNA binding protein
MSPFLSAKELAEYIGINEKKIYFMAKAGKLPCTRVTGKWLFPKNLIDEWIEENSRRGAMIRVSASCAISIRLAKPPLPFFSRQPEAVVDWPRFGMA